jgi:hypothetical protein
MSINMFADNALDALDDYIGRETGEGECDKTIMLKP